MQSFTRSQKLILILLGFTALAITIVALWVVSRPLPVSTPAASTDPGITAPSMAGTSPATEVASLPAASSTPTALPSPLTYTVQAGDTLFAIAARFGVTTQQLTEWNLLNSDLIQPGWELYVSAPETLSPSETKPASTPLAEQPSTSTESSTSSETTGEHWVAAEETLNDIASLYAISPADLRAANAMIGDALLPGQRLIIPSAPVTPPIFQFSVLEGDLYTAYPLVFDASRLTVHTAPNTFPAIDPERLAAMELGALDHLESLFQARLDQRFDLFVAGSVFAPPNRTLRGRSFSLNLQTLYLHDGTGNAADQQYIATHELTHLFTWNVFGMPVSVMLSEGAAVYSGMQAIREQGHLPLETFCAAYLQAGELPGITGSLSFEGHILDLQNYYAAGCFVGHLIEAYGPASFGQLYPSGNYEAVYGKSASDLEDEWRGILSTLTIPDGLSPARLVSSVSSMESNYLDFFSHFTGTALQLTAYRELDLARLALLAGDLDDFDQQMLLFQAALGGQ